jgi:hypothetical protein
MGFSFADEHIRELTLRVANTNPTSIIYIFVYGKDSGIYEKLKNEAKNNNICLLTEKKYNFEVFWPVNSKVYFEVCNYI